VRGGEEANAQSGETSSLMLGFSCTFLVCSSWIERIIFLAAMSLPVVQHHRAIRLSIAQDNEK